MRCNCKAHDTRIDSDSIPAFLCVASLHLIAKTLLNFNYKFLRPQINATQGLALHFEPALTVTILSKYPPPFAEVKTSRSMKVLKLYMYEQPWTLKFYQGGARRIQEEEDISVDGQHYKYA